MTEAIKGVLFDHGEVPHPIDPTKKAYKYLVGFTLITEEKIPATSPTETVIMGVFHAGHMMTEALQGIKKYNAPYLLGDISNAMFDVNGFRPEDLEEIQPS